MALSPMIMNSGFSFILCVKIRSGRAKSNLATCFRTRGSLGKTRTGALCLDQRQHPARAARTAPDLQGRRDQDRARAAAGPGSPGWPARSGCCRASPVAGKGLREGMGLAASVPGAQPTRARAPGRPADRDGRPACVRPSRRLRRRRIVALRPVRAHQHPAARRDAAVLGFPLLDALDGEQVVRVVARLGRHVDDAGRRHQLLRLSFR